MKFACNYSQPLMALIKNEKIALDKIKMAYFGPFMGLHDQVAETCPLLIHGFGWHEHIGMAEPATGNDWQLMSEVLSRYDNEHLVVHLSVFKEDLALNQSPMQALDEGLKTFKEKCGRSLMIENIDYNPFYDRPPVLREAVDPGHITELCEKYDVSLLLDTAHAKVSAWHLGISIERYMEALPLHRIEEVHFIGTQHSKALGVYDCHSVLEAYDYELMDWLMPQMSPKILTLEYGWPGKDFEWRTDIGAIEEQLNEIKHRYKV